METHDFSHGAIWGIRPDCLENILSGLPADIEAAAKLAYKFTAEPQGRDEFMLRDGVAIIPVTGPISKRSSFYSFLFGGSPLNVLSGVFTDAMADPDVEAIVLDMDSPGGTVSGTDAFTDLVFGARGQKPVVAFTGGMMASAAYWIGSAADRVIAERTADVGSIGVVMVHYDFSQMDKMDGIKRTVLSAGKYKAVGNSAEPLGDQARQVLQAELDYIYSLFIDTVARNRGVDAETVVKDMADGRIFIGQQALDAGLVDDIGTLDTAIETAQSLVKASSGGTKYFFTPTGESASPNKEASIMSKENSQIIKPETTEQLAAMFPDLVTAIRADGAKSVNVDQIRTEAAAAEKARILGLVNVQFGAEAGAQFTAVVDTGVTVEQFTAIRGAAPAPDASESDEARAMAAAKNGLLDAIHAAGPDNPGSGAETPTPGKKDFMALVAEHQAVNKSSKVEAMKAVIAAHPEAHEAYLKGVN